MKAQLIGQTVARRALGFRDWTRSLTNRAKIAARDRAEARERELAVMIAPSVEERHSELLRFYHHYEDLVEVLCDAANYGPTSKLESAYAEQRRWMIANYAPIRRYVVAYLRFTPEDAHQSLFRDGYAMDAFEALTAAATLEEFQNGDDGHVISRITRTREALNLYGEHLRQLLARG